MSANVLFSVFNTYTVFLASTVPFVSSADSNVTVQYLLVSCGFPPFGSSGSTGPTIGSCGVVVCSNSALIVMLPLIAVFLSNAGFHPVNLNPAFAVTSGASFARSANVLPAVFGT